MTVLLFTAQQAAETLAAFHQQRAEYATGEAREYHVDMAQRCVADAEQSGRAILANAATVRHQADAVRRHDMETAQRIISRHPIMQGIGMPTEEIAAARAAMVRDIADALQAARGASAL